MINFKMQRTKTALFSDIQLILTMNIVDAEFKTILNGTFVRPSRPESRGAAFSTKVMDKRHGYVLKNMLLVVSHLKLCRGTGCFVNAAVWGCNAHQEQVRGPCVLVRIILKHQFLKYRYLAWVALLFALSGYMNTRPLRTKDGGQGLSGIA